MKTLFLDAAAGAAAVAAAAAFAAASDATGKSLINAGGFESRGAHPRRLLRARSS